MILHAILRIGIVRALNESAGKFFRAATQHRQNKPDNLSKKVAYSKIRNRYNQVPQDISNTNNPQKKCHLGTVSKYILLEGLNRFLGTKLTLSSDVDQDT